MQCWMNNSSKMIFYTHLWHVMEIFETMDDKCDYWSSLLNYIVDEDIPLNEKSKDGGLTPEQSN